MNVSLFPKGRYLAKKTLVFYKTPYSNGANTNRPFALIFEPENGVKIEWDITSFRPDPYFDKDFIEHASTTGIQSIVLYEKINCSISSSKCFNIPRYIYLPHAIDSTKEGKWFVNIR